MGLPIKQIPHPARAAQQLPNQFTGCKFYNRIDQSCVQTASFSTAFRRQREVIVQKPNPRLHSPSFTVGLGIRASDNVDWEGAQMMTFHNIEEKRNVDAVMMHILKRLYDEHLQASGFHQNWAASANATKFPEMSHLNRMLEDEDDDDDFDDIDVDGTDLMAPLNGGEPDVVTWLRGAVIDGMQTGQLLQFEADDQQSEVPETLE